MSGLKYEVPRPPKPTKFPLKSPRGASLATRVWPSKNPKALCLMIHGGGWHSGYFNQLATSLSQDGIFSASYDQIGCGYSEPDPDSPSAGVAHVRVFDWFVEDLCAAIGWMQEEASNTQAPVFLFGESFGALQVSPCHEPGIWHAHGYDDFGMHMQVIAASFEREKYNVKIDGVISSGGLLQLGESFLPPWPVVKVLLFLSKYFPKMIMPATDFESTFDQAFGDKDWAMTARSDPKISMQLKATLGGVAATLGTGDRLRPKASDFPVKFFALHGRHDVRTSCAVMEDFVNKMGPEMGSMEVIDTEGHQLLQDRPEISQSIINKVKTWILNTASDLK